jgi:hypothetical protein
MVQAGFARIYVTADQANVIAVLAMAGVGCQVLGVRSLGDTGVGMGNITFGGADPDIQFTLVYRKEANGWRMIAAHLARSLTAN